MVTYDFSLDKDLYSSLPPPFCGISFCGVVVYFLQMLVQISIASGREVTLFALIFPDW